MKKYVVDTSAEYDDFVGYTHTKETPSGFTEVLEVEFEEAPLVRPKSVDKEFPEQWQDIYINFDAEEDYMKFMISIGMSPGPKIKDFVYDPNNNETNILDFF